MGREMNHEEITKEMTIKQLNEEVIMLWSIKKSLENQLSKAFEEIGALKLRLKLKQ